MQMKKRVYFMEMSKFYFFFKPNNYDIKHMKHNGGILNPSQLCTPVKEKGESFGLLGNENSHLL